MTSIKKVLAAIDLSDYSESVLEHALLQMNGLGAELIVVNIIDRNEVESVRDYILEVYHGRGSVEAYIERQKKERRERIEEMIRSCGADPVEIKLIFRIGIPFDEIIQTVKEEEIDLVVMGRKGQTNLPSLLFGTNAEKVFRHCAVPLLSIRGNGREDLRVRQMELTHKR